MDNGQWKLNSVKVYRSEEKFPCCEHPFSDLTMTIDISRATESYTVNIIIPSAVLSLLAVLVTLLFLLYLREPIERGFFCHDLSIHYPYHETSITTTVNNVICYGVPLIMIFVRSCSHKIENYSEKPILREASFFLFGVLTVQVLS